MTGGRLGIAGVGLIGGSIALRARAAIPGVRIAGFDTDAGTVARALERGILDAPAASLAALAAQSETLVIALPVDATDAALDALAGTPGAALVIDVASVKGLFSRHAERVANYVGTHPMAGRERGGIDAADADLFLGASWAHTPHADPALVERVRAFIRAMGARALEVDAAAHDEIVALTSHLPQALSVVLGAELAAARDPLVFDLCGPGIRSMLRLARSPAALWSPIIGANAGPLSRRLRSIAAALQRAAIALEAGDSEPLMSYFKAARDATAALEQQTPPTPRSSSYRCP